MYNLAVYGMVCLGSILMAYNIYGFVRFSRRCRSYDYWNEEAGILYVPIVLLVLFFLGYLAVGIFVAPDIIVSSILFGGSIFVYVMYRMLERVTSHIIKSESLKGELVAAEKSNEAKSRFLATMSHEMRTPMNVIIGLDEIVLKDPELSDQTREQLEKIGLSARHLLGLINNILDLNSIESGEFHIKSEEFSPRDALGQVFAIMHALCEQKGLVFETRVDESLATCCRGDAMQLKQALFSILDNAVKYTEAPGKVSVALDVASCEDGAQTVSIRISDTGVGMDADFVPRLFKAFEREDSSSTSQFGGGGLSLAVAKQIVDAMGGTIEAQSTKGVGSTFTIVVSLEVVAREEVPGVEAPESVGHDASQDGACAVDEATSLEGRHILIVEDIEENAEILADLLELEGASSDHAENGKVAIDMFVESGVNYYDAVLMDLRMPVMDGLEAARRIRELDRPDARDVPIIAVTANAFESDVRQALEAGMNEHLAKPVDVDLLYTTLQRYMRPALQTEPKEERSGVCD